VKEGPTNIYIKNKNHVLLSGRVYHKLVEVKEDFCVLNFGFRGLGGLL
jgi:hypothetical protein